jgi:hypothetical protein
VALGFQLLIFKVHEAIMMKAKLQPLVLEVSKIDSSFHLGTYRSMEFRHGPQAAQSFCMVPEDPIMMQHEPVFAMTSKCYRWHPPLFLEITPASSIRFCQYHAFFQTPCLMIDVPGCY